jgi:hypothetical protein
VLSRSSRLEPHLRQMANVTAALLAVCCAIVALISAASAWEGEAALWHRAAQLAPAEILFPSEHERFGVGVNLAYGDIDSYDVDALHAGWYLDWGNRQFPPHPAGMDYVHMVRVGDATYPPDWTALGVIVAGDLGAVWLVGNEPDAPYGQDNVTPEVYAERYHVIYTFLKQRDPSAQVAAGGIVQATPLRLQYLDRVLAGYASMYGTPLPTDAWHIHEQILQERRGEWGCSIPAGFEGVNEGMLYSIQDNANPAIFQQHIQAFRQWMMDHGYHDTALYVSEYGVLMPSCYLVSEPACAGGINEGVAGALSVTRFMTSTFEFMLSAVDPVLGYAADGGRLVQRWLWYSLNDKPYDDSTGQWTGFNGGLFHYTTTQMTQYGMAYRDVAVSVVTSYTDLLPKRIQVEPGPVALVGIGGTATFTITVTAWNRGNLPAQDVLVRFWDGDPMDGGVLLGDRLVSSLPSRYGGTGTTELVRGGLSPGSYQVYVSLDPENAVTEIDKSNNSAMVTLLVATNRLFLPVVTKNE